jgi:hypothetical protein
VNLDRLREPLDRAQDHLALRRIQVVDVVDQVLHHTEPNRSLLVGLVGEDHIARRHLLPQDVQA